MASYENSVFINCPFDPEYRSIFQALIFAVHDCGCFARCALAIEDSGQVRIQKIEQVIAECRFGVHDISRTEPDAENRLPRFNMPLELGLFLGAKKGLGFRNSAPTLQGRIYLRMVAIREKQ